jgi:drug/metabolite transporter (DMT)-like permease
MNKNLLTKTSIVCLLAMICCILWGSAFPLIKIGYALLNIAADDSSSQLLFAGYRFTLAGIFTIIIGSMSVKKPLIPRKQTWSKIFVLSLLQTVFQYYFFYIGLAHTTGVKASIIEAANVFVAIFVSGLLFHMEKVTWKKVLGCIIGFAGVILVNVGSSGVDMHLAWNGEGFILCSTISYAFSSVLMKKLSKNEMPVLLSGWQFLVGGLVLTAIGFLSGGQVTGFTLKGMVLLAYLAALSAIAYSLWGILLKYNSVGKVTVFGFMNPVCGVILSALLLSEGSEAFGAKGMIALILVCLGIYVANREN